MRPRDATLRSDDRSDAAGPDRRPATGSSGDAPTAYPGVATAYVLRRIAYDAGTLMPRRQDNILDEPCGRRHGSSLTAVERWFTERGRMLSWLGYHLRCRRTAAPTHDLLAWLRAGCGYRGLVLATSHDRLHRAEPSGDAIAHAVGVVREAGGPEGVEVAVVFDPWSRAITIASEMPALDLAHADRDYQALSFHWIGWS